jgi:hypothetical protein
MNKLDEELDNYLENLDVFKNPEKYPSLNINKERGRLEKNIKNQKLKELYENRAQYPPEKQLQIMELVYGVDLTPDLVKKPWFAKVLDQLTQFKYNYLGPGTDLGSAIVKNTQPINILDKIAQEHDFNYLEASAQKSIEERLRIGYIADDTFIYKTKKLSQKIDELLKTTSGADREYLEKLKIDTDRANFAIDQIAMSSNVFSKTVRSRIGTLVPLILPILGLPPEFMAAEVMKFIGAPDAVQVAIDLGLTRESILGTGLMGGIFASLVGFFTGVVTPLSEEKQRKNERDIFSNENIPEVKEMPTERIRIDEIRKLNSEGKLAEYVSELKQKGVHEIIVEYRERGENGKIQVVHETSYPEDLLELPNEEEKLDMGGAPHKQTGSKKVSDEPAPTPTQATPVSTTSESNLPEYTSPHPPGTVTEARAAQAAEEQRGQEQLARGGVQEIPHPDAENLISGLQESIAGVMSGVSKNPRFDLGRPVVGQSFNKDDYQQSQGGDVALTPEQRAMEEIWFEHWRFIPPGHGNGNQQPSDGLPYPEMRNSLMRAQNMNTQLRYSGDLKHGDVYIAPQYDYRDIPYSKRKIPMRPLFGRHTSWNRANPFQNTGIGKIQFHRQTMQSTPIHNVYDPKVANLYYPNIVDGIRQ